MSLNKFTGINMKFRRFRLKKIRKNPESGKKPGFSDTKRFASVFGVRCRLCETGDVGAMLFTWLGKFKNAKSLKSHAPQG